MAKIGIMIRRIRQRAESGLVLRSFSGDDELYPPHTEEIARKIFKIRQTCVMQICFLSNAQLTHGSLEPAAGNKTGQGEGAEAADAASVTEPVKLCLHF